MLLEQVRLPFMSSMLTMRERYLYLLVCESFVYVNEGLLFRVFPHEENGLVDRGRTRLV